MYIIDICIYLKLLHQDLQARVSNLRPSPPPPQAFPPTPSRPPGFQQQKRNDPIHNHADTQREQIQSGVIIQIIQLQCIFPTLNRTPPTRQFLLLRTGESDPA